jgi:hypothetical protein
MGGAIDGGGSEAADAPREWPKERRDSPWPDGSAEAWTLSLPKGASAVAGEPGADALKDETGALIPENETGALIPEELPYDLDPSLRGPAPAPVDVVPEDLEPGVHLQEVSGLSEIERQSVTDSVNGWVKFAKRRLISLVADHLAPVIGGRIVELAFEVQDVVTSVRALGSDDSMLEAPLPSPVQGLDFTLEIPLASGEEAHAAPPLALCIAPDTPSLTGGWALDSTEQDERPEGGRKAERLPDNAEEEELERELDQRKAASPRRGTTDMAGQRRLQANRSAIGCVVEIDLGSLPLLRRRKLRAWELYVLATEYAPQLRESLGFGRFEVLVIADQQRRCGLWIWLGSDLGDDIFVTR